MNRNYETLKRPQMGQFFKKLGGLKFEVVSYKEMIVENFLRLSISASTLRKHQSLRPSFIHRSSFDFLKYSHFGVFVRSIQENRFYQTHDVIFDFHSADWCVSTYHRVREQVHE